MNSGATPTQGSSVGRYAESDAAGSAARRKPPTTVHPMSGGTAHLDMLKWATFRNVMLAENRRRSNELAVKDMSAMLKQDTLNALRQKALDLQNDKWMYEDVHI